MQSDNLKQILIDQKDNFNRKRPLIERDIDLTTFLKTVQVVVIAGVRRCGKSSLLYLIKEKLELAEQDYCYFNFDDERIIPQTSILDQIYLAHLELYKTEPVFFFDEIQNVPNWEKFVNRIHEKGLKVYVTGSNANLLSSEIATSLTGRNKTITLFPFSFAEYLKCRGKSIDVKKVSSKAKSMIQGEFQEYMKLGGFPLVVQEEDLELLNQYFQDILYRDIIARYRISQVNELKQIALYLASNSGKLFSYSTLQNIAGVKSTSSVKSYLDYLEHSYLFFYLKKFDYSVKKQIMNSRKVYAIDPAVCNRLGSRFSENKGRILETIIFLQLLRMKREVFYHSGKKECDFIVQEGLEITSAIQVAYELSDINVKREVDGLLEAMKAYGLEKGVLITADNQLKGEEIPDQIEVILAWKWLIDNTIS
ncbi:ATP-binding protein [Arthrospiribacter ruber]|uniref:ATP-binding protein n=1 Tax=Arthrospiribacter ruber TaxID=2487934 RepID=A0A951ITR3_9BACT|nr:ATP-binding protein [Arthrospiribacter ruber]MBW3466417.1 ATP-binding protein [Arthrospiribacter ruber]